MITNDSIGTMVEFYDSHGKKHVSLVTAVHGPQCVNVAYCNMAQSDDYGTKIARSTSVMHGSIQQAQGMYWMFPGEQR